MGKKKEHKHEGTEIWIMMSILLTILIFITLFIYRGELDDLREEIDFIKNPSFLCEKSGDDWTVTQGLDCDSVFIAESCVKDFKIWKERNCDDLCVEDVA